MPRRQTTPDVEEAGAEPFQTPQKSSRRAPPADEVSPAATFDTALTSPTTFDRSDVGASAASPPPTKITIDHVTRSSGRGQASRNAGMILGMSKPFLGMGMMFLVSAGAAGFLLNGWLKIPGLNTQIQELEAQVGRLNEEVNRLSGEVDRLESENDRYESLNDQLNQTVAEFELLTDNLNSTVQDLEDVAGDLNVTNQELSEEVDELANENREYAQLNRQLNTTATILATEVSLFAEQLIQLTLENDLLSNMTAVLENLTESLTDLTVDQNETLAALQGTLTGFVAENNRLAKHNDDLKVLISFLNDTASGLDDSLQQVTSFLADQIVVNRELVLQSLENAYRQKVSNWDCDYRDVFREEDFGQDFNVPIAADNLDQVLTYMDGRVLSELCLDTTDFSSFLNREYPDGSITTFRLIRGALLYTDEAFDFYFPETGEAGLTTEDWSNAKFDCQNLATAFSWNNQ